MRGFLIALGALFLAISAPGAEPPAVRIAPAESREVVAEGRAAIDFAAGGVEAARTAAVASALRAAVEKTVGVFVSSRTLTQNYQLVRDEVTVRADGFATLEEVLAEKVGAQAVTVTIRAMVSVRPLAQQLKALGLIRQWRLRIQPSRGVDPDQVAGARAALEKALAEAGFTVMENSGDADVQLELTPTFTEIAARPLETAVGPVTMHTIRGTLVARALRMGTGQVVAAASSEETALHIEPETARRQSVDRAAAALAAPLIDALLVLPASAALPVPLVAGGLTDRAQVDRLETALAQLSGVDEVVRRSFAPGRTLWELSVRREVADRWVRELERSTTVHGLGLVLISESRSRVLLVVPKAARKNRTQLPKKNLL